MRFLYTSDLTIAEYKVILFIIRQTSGFHRDNKKLSAGFIAKGTNITPSSVQRAIAKLHDKGIIEIASKHGAPNVLGLAATYDHTVVSNEQTYDQAVVGDTTVQSQVPTTELSYKERNRERNIKEREGTPTLDDVISYCEQMSFAFPPEKYNLNLRKKNLPIIRRRDFCQLFFDYPHMYWFDLNIKPFGACNGFTCKCGTKRRYLCIIAYSAAKCDGGEIFLLFAGVQN